MASAFIRSHGIVFVHVPKTGGASVRAAMTRAAENGAIELDLRPNRNVRRRTTAASWVERNFGHRIWHDARCLAFVRNPWDWTVSGWLHVTRNRPHYSEPPDFKAFVAGGWSRGIDRQQHAQKFVSPNASVAYHTQVTPWRHLHPSWWRRLPPYAMIGRFERFETDWAEFLVGAGLDIPLVEHVNRSRRKHYSTYYDDATREIVARRHRALIQRFGYRFED